MSSIDIVKTTKYFAITDTLSYSEYNNFEQAFATKYKFLIRQKIGSNMHHANSGAIWQNYASVMEFIGKEEQIVDSIEENDWKYSFDHFGFTSGYGYTDMWIKFIDKFGFANSEERFDISIEGFLQSYKRFSELKNYDGYKYAKIAIENLELNEKVIQYETKNNALEQENSKLKTLLSSLS